jgi:hypothetical protein
VGKGSLLERLGFAPKPPMSIEVFREQVIEVLILEQPRAIIERRNRDEVEVQWEVGATGPLTFSVQEAYAWYLKEPRELIAAIQNAAIYILISSVSPTLDMLTVVVQGADYHPQPNPENPPLARLIVNGLLAIVAIDNRYGYQFLGASSLRDELNLDDADLWSRGLQNTIARLEIDDVPLDRGRPTDLLRGDGLATSLILVDEFWDAPRQSEALVVAPIAPNKLAVAPERDRRSIRLLRESMRSDPLDRQWRRFKGLLVRREGRWEVLP